MLLLVTEIQLLVTQIQVRVELYNECTYANLNMKMFLSYPFLLVAKNLLLGSNSGSKMFLGVT
jgi:hypothetical protein